MADALATSGMTPRALRSDCSFESHGACTAGNQEVDTLGGGSPANFASDQLGPPQLSDGWPREMAPGRRSYFEVNVVLAQREAEWLAC